MSKTLLDEILVAENALAKLQERKEGFWKRMQKRNPLKLEDKVRFISYCQSEPGKYDWKYRMFHGVVKDLKVFTYDGTKIKIELEDGSFIYTNDYVKLEKIENC